MVGIIVLKIIIIWVKSIRLVLFTVGIIIYKIKIIEVKSINNNLYLFRLFIYIIITVIKIQLFGNCLIKIHLLELFYLWL